MNSAFPQSSPIIWLRIQVGTWNGQSDIWWVWYQTEVTYNMIYTRRLSALSWLQNYSSTWISKDTWEGRKQKEDIVSFIRKAPSYGFPVVLLILNVNTAAEPANALSFSHRRHSELKSLVNKENVYMFLIT